jgi:hypothetical protein
MKRVAYLALLGVLTAGCGSVAGAEDLFSGGSSGQGASGATGSTGVGGAGSGTTTGTGSTSTTGTASSSSTSGETTSTGVGGMGGASSTTSTGEGGATTTTTSATTTTSTTTTGSGIPLGDIGCSDGTREYFDNLNQYPDIAGCAGGFLVPGVTTNDSMQPKCNRQGGNDGQYPNGGDGNQNGVKCSVEDLCTSGWHVCHGKADVSSSSPNGCAPGADANEFWLTRQGQSGQGVCWDGTVNNLTGCGGLGNATGDQQGWQCSPLTTWMNYQVCIPTQAWFCGNGQQNDPNSGITNEAQIVVKLGPQEGGVLCCRD